MPKTVPYQYSSQDDPTKLADKYGITPTQLINANPGGYPFGTGQTINIPQFGPPAPPTPQATPFNFGGSNPVYVPPGLSNNQRQQAKTQLINGPLPNNYNVDQRGRGYKDITTNPYYRAQAGIQQAVQDEISNAMSSTGGPPSTLSPAAASALGINPTQAGYLMQNGQWVFNPEYAKTLETAQTTDTGAGGGDQQSYDPRNIAYTWNKYAKNPKSRFETNLKWAQNSWKRKKQMAKGDRVPGNIAAQQQAAAQTDNNITGFGLVNFSASSG